MRRIAKGNAPVFKFRVADHDGTIGFVVVRQSEVFEQGAMGIDGAVEIAPPAAPEPETGCIEVEQADGQGAVFGPEAPLFISVNTVIFSSLG